MRCEFPLPHTAESAVQEADLLVQSALSIRDPSHKLKRSSTGATGAVVSSVVVWTCSALRLLAVCLLAVCTHWVGGTAGYNVFHGRTSENAFDVNSRTAMVMKRRIAALLGLGICTECLLGDAIFNAVCRYCHVQASTTTTGWTVFKPSGVCHDGCCIDHG